MVLTPQPGSLEMMVQSILPLAILREGWVVPLEILGWCSSLQCFLPTWRLEDGRFQIPLTHPLRSTGEISGDICHTVSTVSSFYMSVVTVR